MYIDFHKYNYDLVPADKKADYIKRDQESYKQVLQKWFNDNLENVVQRKWEINEIHYLKNISDFIKLIREGEQLYELGFFTGCIALVGVASEDFLKYLAISLGKPQYETQTQFNRLNNLLNDNLISSTTHTLLDNIRQIRNDCLHYNQNFKQKSNEDLKNDALTALNNLKDTLKSIIGGSNPNDLISVIEGIGAGDDIKNTDEIAIKVKNAVSHLLKFPIAFDPKTKIQVRTSIFTIKEIDEEFDEISLQDLGNGFIAIVEYPESERTHYQSKQLSENDTVIATLTSVLDQNGLTAEWKLLDIDKI
jgi:DNA mismatch repair ATPase MutS